MRLLFLAAALSAAAAAAAHAQDAPNARAAYVERRGLVELDSQCRLFTPSVRSALEVGVARTRGALLRAGWNVRQLAELEQAVIVAARGRSCADQRTLTSAASAREAFSVWVNARNMEFPGWERTWIARRAVGGEGWRLSQAIDGPVIGVFGVREHGGAQRLSLVIPSARGETPPDSATLVMRDPARGSAQEVSLPQRVAYGLAAGTPAPNIASSHPSMRTIERLDNGATQAVFAFPDTAFRDLLRLDPRESVEIRLQQGTRTQRLLVEVGDVAAARAFLMIR